MRKGARRYAAALLFGALLLIPTGSLVPQASAEPQPLAFLDSLHPRSPAASAFAALLPGLTLQVSPPAARSAAVKVADRTPAVRASVTIKEGQALWDIALAYGVTVEAIVATNGLKNAALIKPGQILLIPASATAAARRPAAKPAANQPAATLAVRTPVYHVVASGDTLWVVARRYGLTVSTLARMNRMSETALIRPGQRLALAGTTSVARPATVGSVTRGSASTLTVTVQQGQALSEIARAHSVSVQALVEANGLSSAHRIRAGQRLKIPGTSAAASPRLVQRVSAPRVAVRPRVTGGFVWPARGVVTSRFGWRWRRHHNGMDIAAPRGTPIYATRAGTVTRAGWYYGYGLTVMIDHGGGVTTIYGHASSVWVRSGQRVATGQQIARIGCTGSCTGNHVHFEVRVNGRPVNPLRYL